MICEILKSNNPKLRIKSKPVSKLDKKTKEIIKDLYDTLLAQKDPEGIGLAAPQIGKNLRIFLMKDKDTIKTIINPEIVEIKKDLKNKSNKKKPKLMEGCLSLPHYYSPLTRYEYVTIKYKDENWEDKVETFIGLSAQIIQHEIDHLNGILFIDHVVGQQLPLYEHTKDGQWQKVELT
ncbi:MAG: peptide deformylase [Patescibacteria group bacterium]|nr:peptide deformylase [Patescibacteria group bacterium]